MLPEGIFFANWLLFTDFQSIPRAWPFCFWIISQKTGVYHHVLQVFYSIHSLPYLSFDLLYIWWQFEPSTDPLVATDFQSSFLQLVTLFSLLPSLKNDFLTTIFPLRPFLLRLQWKVDVSTEWHHVSLKSCTRSLLDFYFLFLKDMTFLHLAIKALQLLGESPNLTLTEVL